MKKKQKQMSPLLEGLFLPTLHRILVPQAGIKSIPSALEAQSLNHWTTRKVPITGA